MADYRLTFPDQATWMAQADAAGWVQREYAPQPPTPPDEPPPTPIVKREWIATPGAVIVDIGTVYEPQPPAPLPPAPQPTPVPYPGYAVNVRCFDTSLPEGMVQYIVMPANPQYTFAGGWEQGTP
jgi:hypothetical protein